jgi:chitin deacetylase
MKMKLVIFIVTTIFVVGFLLFQISKSRTFQFFGELIARVNTNQKVVALTFDDAPSPYVKEVLSILKEKQIKATFYEIGKGIEQYPLEAKTIVDSKMEVGNHSYSHERMVLKSPSFIDNEIQKTNELIKSSGYRGEITFRPPNGKKLFILPWYLKQRDIKTIMWDVEPDTYVSGDSGAITKYTLDTVQPGSIILIHPLCNKECAMDREALPKIIDGLKLKGYKFVTISELLKY